MYRNTISIPIERIQKAIFLIRGQKVMLDRDLAELYGVKTKALKQAVKRNINRFPEDFMFVLSEDEFQNWRSQFVTSNGDRMGLRYSPMAFTEQGVSMLSSVLNSERAVEVNIAIMRIFVRIRKVADTDKGLRYKLEEMEKKYDRQFQVVFEAIKAMMNDGERLKKRIGFEVKEGLRDYGSAGKEKKRKGQA